MRHLILIALLVISNLCQAQDTTKVLFIGNSYTSQNDLPNLFKQLSIGTGKNVTIASHMPGGISVGDISQGTSAHMNNPIVYSLIRSDDWDYLVLQDNQGRFCLGYGQFPPSSLVIEGHLKLRDSLLYYHPCAHMIWFAGFGPKNGYPPYGNTGEALIDSIYRNYQFLSDTAHQIIAPIGPAFKRIIAGFPSINLWGSDDTHPSLYGSSLIANILYTTVFKSSPISSSYNPGIATSEDSLLKNTAYQTTIDSLNYTGLIEITPVINQIGNTLSVSGFQNCSWFYNENPYVSNNCMANMNQSGNYYAVVTDSNGCAFRTVENTFLFTGINENSLISKLDINVYPNPAHDIININAPKSTEIQIINVAGQIIRTIYCISNETSLLIRDIPDGIYIIKAKNATGNAIMKFIKE